ncbi:hypothetical protein HDU85_004106 [Gaertneriomyces sp. JEL0708]|nr:hypothetical protein HDU85_004106 [Gaertneriomyces sp. JEL0708]
MTDENTGTSGGVTDGETPVISAASSRPSSQTNIAGRWLLSDSPNDEGTWVPGLADEDEGVILPASAATTGRGTVRASEDFIATADDGIVDTDGSFIRKDEGQWVSTDPRLLPASPRDSTNELGEYRRSMPTVEAAIDTTATATSIADPNVENVSVEELDALRAEIVRESLENDDIREHKDRVDDALQALAAAERYLDSARALDSVEETTEEHKASTLPESRLSKPIHNAAASQSSTSLSSILPVKAVRPSASAGRTRSTFRRSTSARHSVSGGMLGSQVHDILREFTPLLRPMSAGIAGFIRPLSAGTGRLINSSTPILRGVSWNENLERARSFSDDGKNIDHDHHGGTRHGGRIWDVERPSAASPRVARGENEEIDTAESQKRITKSLSERMEAAAHAQARSISQKIVTTAAEFANPVSRLSIMAASPRPSSATSITADAKRAASASSGPRHKSRPSTGKRKRTAKEYWKLLRDHYLPGWETKSPSLTALLGILQMQHLRDQSIPYSITLRHGFLLKAAMRPKRSGGLVCTHVRVRKHLQSEGAIGASISSEDAEDDGEDDENAVDEETEVDAQTSKRNESLTPYTFLHLDAARTATLYDLTRHTAIGVNGGIRPRSVVTVEDEISEIAFLQGKSIYVAGCGWGMTFYNARFEPINRCHTLEATIFIRYNKITQELITASTHTITVWGLEATKIRGVLRITPVMTHTIDTQLPTEEWITGLWLDEKGGRIFVVAGRSVLVYSSSTGETLDTLRNISRRRITSLLWHEAFGYLVVGCSDGSIQARIISPNTLIHTLTNHTAAVTSLAEHPSTPSLFVSCGNDRTLRISTLKGFREVWCLNLRDVPLMMQIMDATRMCIFTGEQIQVWSFSHVNTGFVGTNSAVRSLSAHTCSVGPLRVIARTEDGIIRILSPISGKSLTTVVPLLETDYLKCLAYCGKIDRLYLMLDNGEIWVAASNYNPCVVVNIWKSQVAVREDITHITVFDGDFTDDTSYPPHYNDRDKGFAFLLGSTKNGQVVVYGRRGGVRDRYQLHSGEITQLLCDTRTQLVVTAGTDEMIKICKVNPSGPDILRVAVSISTHSVPRLVAVMDGTLCAAFDDWTVQMYSFRADRGEWRIGSNHNRSDDHTDTVTVLQAVPELSLFVSGSKDGTLRVWDAFNVLVREVQFQEPIDTLCVASPRGDLLFGYHDRLDIIRYDTYLPPGYIQTAQKLDLSNFREEPAVPFDEERTEWKDLQHRQMQRSVAPSHEKWQLFPEINLVGQDRTVPGASVTDTSEAEEALYKELMRRMDVLSVKRQQLIESMRKRMESEMADERRKEEIMHEAYMHYARNRKYLGTSGEALDEIPTDWVLTTPEVRTPELRPESAIPGPNMELLKLKDQVPITKTTLKQKGRIIKPLRPRTRTGENPSIVIPTYYKGGSVVVTRVARDHRVKDTAGGDVAVAPDGSVPNSLLRKKVDDWAKEHQREGLADRVTRIYAKRKKESVKKESEEKKRRSDEYKARLKEMLEALPQEVDEEDADGDEGNGLATPEDGGDGGEEVKKSRLPSNRTPGRFKPLSARVVVNKVLEVEMPGPAKKLMQYDWCPTEQLFHPGEPSVTDPLGIRTTRQLKIDPNSDQLLNPVLDVFRAAPSFGTRTEVVEYLNWVYDEYGIQDTTNVMRMLCRYLMAAPSAQLTQDEVELRSQILDTIAKFNPNNQEVIPTLLLQLTSPHEELREKATSFLRTLGVHTPDSSLLMETVSDIVMKITDVPGSLSSQSPAPAAAWGGLATTTEQVVASAMSTNNNLQVHELRTALGTLLRKELKSYLVRATPNREVAKQIQRLTIFGLPDKSKVSEEEEEPENKPGSRGSAGSRASKSRPTSGSSMSRPIKVSVRTVTLENVDASFQEGIARAGSAGSGSGKRTIPSPSSSQRSGEATDGMDQTDLTRSDGSPAASGRKRMVTFDVAPVEHPVTTDRPVVTVPRPQPVTPDSNALPSSLVQTPSASRPTSAKSTTDFASDVDILTLVTYRQSPGSVPHTPSSPFSYPDLRVEYPSPTRNPTTILQNPHAQDYITALNYHIYKKRDAALREEQKRLALLREAEERVAREAEEARKQAERQELLKKRKSEREERRRRLEEQKLKKERDEQERRNRELGIGLHPPRKMSEMRTKGIGLTHQSACHDSRETIDYEYRKFPPISGHPHHHTNISMHIRKYNRSMPMERVEILPFASNNPSKGPISSAATTMSPTSYLRDLSSVLPSAELAYIRSEMPHGSDTGIANSEAMASGSSFRTQRKYFIPALAVAYETIASGQTLGLAE